jgi:hypothetical protein
LIIAGRFIDDAPYFPATLVYGEHQGVIWLLADVGASHTTILGRDLEYLDIPFSKLELAETRLVGIGGSARTFLLRDVQIAFISDKGDLLLTCDLRAIQHDVEKISPDDAKILFEFPSVLGRDIINQFEFCCDYQAGTVSLKRRG